MENEQQEDVIDYWDNAESSWSEDDNSDSIDSLTSDEDNEELRDSFELSVQNGTVRLINEFADMLSNHNRDNEEGIEEPNFDYSLASKHEYLGNEMEELSGRTLLDEGSILWLPVVFDLNIILVPGQTLPLTVSNSANVAMLRDVITGNKTFGIVCCHIGQSGKQHVGTTAEVFEFQESWSGTGVNIKAKGRQRFRLLEEKRQLTGIVHGRVQVLPEVCLPSLLECRIISLDRYRRNRSFLSKNGRMDISSSIWPRWVHLQYDAKTLTEKVLTELTALNYVTSTTNVPKTTVNLSYWVVQSLPFDDNQRIAMLNMNTAEERLQFTLQHIKECSAIYCGYCGIQVASRHDIFSMSEEGPQGAYCNPGGHVHEIITVHRASLSLVRQPPSTEFSWFPGYAWTIAHCNRCKRHIGWQFTAVEPQLSPLMFWSLTKRSVTIHNTFRADQGVALREFLENVNAFA